MLLFQTNLVKVKLFPRLTLSFVPINVHSCWQRGRKRSVDSVLQPAEFQDQKGNPLRLRNEKEKKQLGKYFLVPFKELRLFPRN